MADAFLLSIEKLIYGGDALAHTEANTVFVPFVLPGERVMASVRTRRKNLIHANLLKVEQASSARVAPPCPHFGVCGGCHYQHIEFEAVLALVKQQQGLKRRKRCLKIRHQSLGRLWKSFERNIERNL